MAIIKMKIRRARKKDLPAIIKIIKAVFHSNYPAAGEIYLSQLLVDPNYATATGPYYSREVFIKSLISDTRNKFGKPFEVFLVESDTSTTLNIKEIIGFIILENNKGNYWITNIMVKKKYQGKGVGKKLFDFATNNKKPLYLWVNAKNSAVKFWKNFGFKEILREILMIKK